ncbi:MAG: SDR family oxidoreductase [Deltaproteobacteria bacterium]|nr:SDR family oxidoreductase [Deltaproteobacteria bacterium]
MARFQNKHVIITGAARGIGFEIARQFAREGARLRLLDRREDDLAQAISSLQAGGTDVTGVVVDVTKRSDVIAAVHAADDDAPIDVLVNNAGIAYETGFLNIEEEEWRRIIDVNLTGAFFVAQAVARKMVVRRRGAIVHMASKNGLDGESGYAHYNASKAGLVLLTKTMALELAAFGIRVNAVCPGYVATPLAAELDSAEVTTAFAERYIPQERVARPEEIAPLFLFLASDDASFVTGACLTADGGQLAGQKPDRSTLARLGYSV